MGDTYEPTAPWNEAFMDIMRRIADALEESRHQHERTVEMLEEIRDQMEELNA
jgi:hypothetical protein